MTAHVCECSAANIGRDALYQRQPQGLAEARRPSKLHVEQGSAWCQDASDTCHITETT